MKTTDKKIVKNNNRIYVALENMDFKIGGKRKYIFNKKEQQKIVKNNNRIYVTLDNTEFNIGDKYEYTFNKKEQQLLISKSEVGNTVSKKRSGKNLRPLIDIRNKSVLKEFQDFEELKIEVLDSKVIVTGYKKKVSAKIVENVLSFTQIKANYEAKKQQTFQLALDLNFVDKVVGSEFAIANQELLNNLPKETKYALKVVSLFSGAGFSDYGLTLALHEEFKFKLYKAYDYEPDACETYAYNLGNHIELQDITKLDLSTIPSADIMLATPSCLGYSNANRSKSEDRRKQQNELTKYAVDAIKANKTCKVFIMENVPGIRTAENGYYFNYILEELKDFEITWKVLNSAEFGVAQNRKRLFIIGSKIGKIEMPEPTHTKEQFQTVREALHGLDLPESETIPNHMDRTTSGKEVRERMKYIPHGGSMADVPDELKTKATHANSYKRLHPDKQSNTVVNFRKTTMMPPYADRTLSVREGCRLMGMPDSFIIKGSLGFRQQQVCNGVVPQIMKAIGEQVLKAYKNFFDQNGILSFPQ